MKTNASPRSVIKAVETVSAEKYNGNVVFMNAPKKITKYVCRFTLRTKDVNGPGSMVTKTGQKQPKANWDVQQDVMNEILKINPYPNIYVDTIYGRKFSNGQNILEEAHSEPDTQEVEQELEPVVQETHHEPAAEKKHEFAPRQTRPYNRRAEKPTIEEKPTGRKKPKVINGKAKLLSALKYVLKHPELLD